MRGLVNRLGVKPRGTRPAPPVEINDNGSLVEETFRLDWPSDGRDMTVKNDVVTLAHWTGDTDSLADILETSVPIVKTDEEEYKLDLPETPRKTARVKHKMRRKALASGILQYKGGELYLTPKSSFGICGITAATMLPLSLTALYGAYPIFGLGYSIGGVIGGLVGLFFLIGVLLESAETSNGETFRLLGLSSVFVITTALLHPLLSFVSLPGVGGTETVMDFVSSFAINSVFFLGTVLLTVIGVFTALFVVTGVCKKSIQIIGNFRKRFQLRKGVEYVDD